MKTNWDRITDPKTMVTLKEHHGKVIRVGKHNFRRIWIKGGWDFWNYGYTDITWIKDTPIYFKDGDWYKEI